MGKWIMGIDPAQRVAYTGIVLVETTTRADARDRWYSVKDGEQGEEWVRPQNSWCNNGLIQATRPVRIDVRWIGRLQLTPYPDQVAYVAERLNRVRGKRVDLVMDITGVGRAFYDFA